MGTKSWPGGVVRKTPVTPAGSFQDSAASGVWTLQQAAYWNKQGLWPTAGNASSYALINAPTSIDRFLIATDGNGVNFGTLSAESFHSAACASNIRAFWGGGHPTGGGNFDGVATVKYVGFKTGGTSTDFGDLTVARFELQAASNNIRGLFAKGYNSNVYYNTIDYITLSSSGNAIDFGDTALVYRNASAAGFSNTTRAIWAGGFNSSSGQTNVLEYVTIASAGNTIDFGDLLATFRYGTAVANETRGLVTGGFAVANTIQYVTMATTGNATDFGDLVVAAAAGGVASSTRAVFSWGFRNEYVTIATTGNGTEFGDLSINVAGGDGGYSAGASESAAAVQPTPTSAAMALFFGGEGVVKYTNVDYINIATTGDSVLFGDLLADNYIMGACSSSTRAIAAGGDPSTNQNSIYYISYSTFGKVSDFGDLITTAAKGTAACSNETRGIIGGGSNASGIAQNVIQYITIASVGDATDFGDLLQATLQLSSCSSTTRGVFGGGFTTTAINVIQYITIASVGNSTDFGDLTTDMNYPAGCSSSTRGLFGGYDGGSYNTINYITIASTGNALDFGDLSSGRNRLAAASSGIRGVFAGGQSASAVKTNIIDYVTIASTGNATDFGDLTRVTVDVAGCSNAHGGL